MRLDHLLSGKLHTQAVALKRSHLSVVGRMSPAVRVDRFEIGGDQLGSVAQLVRAPS